MVNVLFADVLLIKDRSFELKLARVRELFAVFTIELVRDNPNENFILHQNAVFVLFESDVELKGAVVGGPGMVALVAPKLEVPLLETLDDKELLVVPVVVVFLKEASEGSLVRPLYTDPLEGLLLLLH